MNKLYSATIFISIALTLFSSNVRAQLIPDNTLGNENTRVINNVNINGLNSDRISGGASRGTNLFHSFREFNIDFGRGAYLVNPPGIENILTRVTGANPSNIFGTLGVEGNANLFLINPNGIIFGNGARLDLNGAFYASTASEIELGNTGNFSASNPNSSNLLSVKPSALFFNALAAHQNQITVRGDLETRQGQTIGLYGGNILIDGGTISAPSGQIFLGAVNSGRVNLDINNNRIDYSGVNSFKDIQITGSSRLRADPENINGKGIDIAGNNLLINGGSQISVNTSGSGNGGNINIDARNIEISGFFKFIDPNNGNEAIERSQITANVGENATENGGNIEINTNNLRVLNAARIRADTESIDASGAIGRRGNGGNINIKANNSVEVSGFAELRLANGDTDREASQIQADVRRGATGNGGRINIDTSSLKLSNRGEIRAETSGAGNAGNININATNLFEISGSGVDIEVDTSSEATGNAGNININTTTLKILDRSDITANTFGSGNGGDINFTADLIQIADGGTDIEANVGDADNIVTGNGGNINIKTNTLQLLNGADITVENYSEGNAGAIRIDATNSVELIGNGSDIVANVNQTATGNGGNININTANLRILDNADIDLQIRGSGNGGLLAINASNSIEMSGDGSDIRAIVNENATGRGADININTDTLRILDRADIQVDTRGIGDAGDLLINARAIELSSGGGIEADVGNGGITEATGNGGNITINTDSLRMFSGGEIAIETFAINNFGRGNAGELTITANSIFISDPQSRITTNIQIDRDGNLATGNGGNIIINTNDLNINDGGSIEANNLGLGVSGSIDIRSDLLRLDNGIISALTETTSNGGNINLNIDRLLTLRNSSSITTESRSIQPEAGKGGNIIIETPFIAAFPRNNEIIAGSINGQGGEITISSLAIFGFPRFLTINADSGVGIDGTVTIDTLDISPGSILRQLESTPVDVTAVVASDLCRLQDGKIARGSSFIITGRGGLPPTPFTKINSQADLLDWAEITSGDRTSTKQKVKPIVINNSPEVTSFVEAKGWIKRADGAIVLTANPVTNSTPNSNLVHPSCDR